MTKKKKNVYSEKVKIILTDDILGYIVFYMDLEDKKVKQLMRQYYEQTQSFAIWPTKSGIITEGFKEWLKENLRSTPPFLKSGLLYSDSGTSIQKSLEELKQPKEVYENVMEYEEAGVDGYIIKPIRLNDSDGIFKLLGSDLVKKEKHTEKLRTMKPLTGKKWEHNQEELKKLRIKSQRVEISNNIIIPKTSDYDILIIDDDIALIRLLRTLFESKDITCKGVVSGTEALEELENRHPKVIFLDIILPDFNGYEMCKKIKFNPKLKDVPVIFIPTIPISEVKKHLAETRADGYIAKPFAFSDLDKIVELLKK
ncbi:MAG: response regulator [Promethearchaeota archaeon]|nr:MAG: response regulator [Candidatus Lokiarchaeota archaeon]